MNLEDFVRESNRIEGIVREPTDVEIEAHEEFLTGPVTDCELEEFVSTIQPGAVLRDKPGLDVRVGNYFPPRGGEHIRESLVTLLSSPIEDFHDEDNAAYQRHIIYETLHPFTDGNGRSGRVLWLSDMGGILCAPLGFLHHFYYQTLRAKS